MKKMLTLGLAVSFLAATAIAASAFTCTVASVAGETVTLKCKEEFAKKLEVGKEVKVSNKDKKAAEGC